MILLLFFLKRLQKALSVDAMATAAPDHNVLPINKIQSSSTIRLGASQTRGPAVVCLADIFENVLEQIPKFDFHQSPAQIKPHPMSLFR